MRKPDESHLIRLTTLILLGVSLLALFLPSCSRKDSNGADSKANVAANTNPSAISNSTAKTNVAVMTNSTVDTNTLTKGIARVEPAPLPKPAPVSPPYHQVFVLCVGINSNPAYGNLRFAVSDATKVAETFRNVYGFTNVTLLTNEKATRSNVLAALEDIRGRLSHNTNDDFIFYFSGHGDTWSQLNMQNGKTNITRSGFLVAYNEATNDPLTLKLPQLRERNLELTVLASNITQMPARHRLVFLDSCFSGLAYIDQPLVEKRPDDFNCDLIDHPTVQIMTAGLDTEQAVENPWEEQGVFTAALLKQLTNDSILTMEEIFFPLRVAVRNSLGRMEAKRTMTPQLRYLVYKNGSFLFVPLDQLPAWAKARSDKNATMTDAETKGFLRPVTAEEATNMQSVATNSPEKQQEEADRYEARAAMGDPYATIALAQMYNGGIGVTKDPARAKIYTAESSDFIIAANTLHFEALAGLTNESLQTIIGGLSIGLNLYGLLHNGGLGLAKNQNNIAAAQEGIKAATPVAKKVYQSVAGFFGASPTRGITSRQEKVKKWLANPTEKNINNAKNELIDFEDDLAKLGKKWQPDQQPAEIGELKTLVQETKTELDQSHPDLAAASIDKIPPVIDELKKIIKGQSGGKQP